MSPTYLGNPHDSPIWQEVADELDQAMDRHAPMHSPHEGHSVIREELDELWEHVRADTGRSPEARKEAVQIAAMGLRYALDLCGPKGGPGPCDGCEVCVGEIDDCGCVIGHDHTCRPKGGPE